jgi:thiol-disulfide isomerase/thioredoxin
VTSFPYIQRAYDNYKSNDKVVFFAVNTYEHQWGREREAIVKKFINDNKYTFPVLFDEGIAVKYEVEAIPTTVVIDRAGKIQFRKVGSEGEEIIRRLSAQIDLLLNNEFYVK